MASHLTSVLREFSPIDLVLHHVSPVKGAMVQVEIQGDGVPQPRDQHAELSLVEVNPPDLMAVGEDDEGLEGIWRNK